MTTKNSLRPYQIDMKREIFAEWEKPNIKNVLLVLPTGMGKTRTFVDIAIDLAINGVTGQKLNTAIMVHRKELVQQISLTLSEHNVHHNIIAPNNVIKGITASQRLMFNKQFYQYNAPVSVISVDTLNARIMRHEQWAKSIKFWITDEAAHLLKNNKWGRAVGYFKDAVGLGVTATPERLDKRGLGSHVDGVFDSMVVGPNSRWGIQNGFLCKYKVAMPESDYQDHLRAASADSDFSKESMVEAAEKSHIIGDVVVNYRKFADGKQAIIFASDIGSASKMEREFEAAGIKSKLLTGNTEDAERLQALIDYRNKVTQVLINVDLFDEGLDVPGIECVIMARPTMSLGKYLQMIGRGLRPAKGKEYLIIIDHVGNVTRHGLPDSRRTWSLDRVKKRRKKLNLIRICGNHLCNLPFDRILTTCPYCGEEDKPGKRGPGGGRPGPAQVDGDLMLLDPETIRQMERGTHLEEPGVVAARVGAAAGVGAAHQAAQRQLERINMQKELSKQIALWAGKLRQHGYSDRQIHKQFYLDHEMTITDALSQPRAEMQATFNVIEENL